MSQESHFLCLLFSADRVDDNDNNN